ncbi:MAG: hypothetical protein FJW23_14110 [Acidimicrobiia bacterium]|nr:hypothetical protein [Acidimicrobiia bacterium]
MGSAASALQLHRWDDLPIEQVSATLSWKITLGGTEVVGRAGEVLCIPSWLEHSAETMEGTALRR